MIVYGQSLKYECLEGSYMPESDEVEKKIRETLLDLGDEELCAQLEEVLAAMKERDRMISETLEGLLDEVDELILLADELDDEDSMSG